MNLRNKKDVIFSTRTIGKAFKTDSKPTYFEKHYRENMCYHDYHVKKGDSVLYNEKAGNGKTQKLYELVKQSDKCVVLSYTNKAVDNVKTRFQAFGYDKTQVNKMCHTFGSYFCGIGKVRSVDSFEGKHIFIEEFNMIPHKWMTTIFNVWVLL